MIHEVRRIFWSVIWPPSPIITCFSIGVGLTFARIQDTSSLIAGKSRRPTPTFPTVCTSTLQPRPLLPWDSRHSFENTCLSFSILTHHPTPPSHTIYTRRDIHCSFVSYHSRQFACERYPSRQISHPGWPTTNTGTSAFEIAAQQAWPALVVSFDRVRLGARYRHDRLTQTPQSD